jgi:Tol biopolymer transport system component
LLGFAVQAAPATAAEACPNEGLRQESNLNPFNSEPFSMQLPDCRAYELVTPPFKAGSNPEGVAVSADGQSQIFGTTGAVAGTQSDSSVAYYEATRGATGWTTTAISPDASRFPASKLFAASTDLRRTLWATRTASQSIDAVDLYTREPNGEFVAVGPMAPPVGSGGPPAGGLTSLNSLYQFAGTSSDLTHVLFSTLHIHAGANAGELWPGDTTAEEGNGLGGSSLYEYSGVDNSAPTLVGVSDGGTTRGEQLLPKGTLISSCSTFLGSESSLDAYDAISADGGTIYFTARGHNQEECHNPAAPEVSELYARVGGISTVPISEPRPAQCSRCRTEARRPAEFRGASEDGSKVFFTTEQELLPGTATTNLYEYDFDQPSGEKLLQVSTGSPAPEVQGVARVSEDGSHVYFLAKGVLTSSPNGEGFEPTEGADNLYVSERDAAHPEGQITFIATLSPEDEATDWNSFLGDLRSMNATPDGRFLVFSSVADLTPGDTSSAPQIFEYDSQSEELIRISVGQAGYAAGNAHADAHSSLMPQASYVGPISGGLKPTASASDLAVSDDGSTVVFGSRGALTPDAEPAEAAGARSVYEYRSAGTISHGDVHLISGAGQTLNAGVPFIDASGSDVFFRVTSRLVPEDVDTQADFYDARSFGGFPESAATAPCTGEGCLGPVASGQPSLTPASAKLSGSGAPPKPELPTRQQRLQRALSKCRRKHGDGRNACEAKAKRRYGKARTGANGRAAR